MAVVFPVTLLQSRQGTARHSVCCVWEVEGGKAHPRLGVLRLLHVAEGERCLSAAQPPGFTGAEGLTALHVLGPCAALQQSCVSRSHHTQLSLPSATVGMGLSVPSLQLGGQCLGSVGLCSSWSWLFPRARLFRLAVAELCGAVGRTYNPVVCHVPFSLARPSGAVGLEGARCCCMETGVSPGARSDWW